MATYGWRRYGISNERYYRYSTTSPYELQNVGYGYYADESRDTDITCFKDFRFDSKTGKFICDPYIGTVKQVPGGTGYFFHTNQLPYYNSISTMIRNALNSTAGLRSGDTLYRFKLHNNFNGDFCISLDKYEIHANSRETKGAYIDQVTSTSSTTYPKNGKSGGYWYEYIGLLNEAPQISGSDSFLGNKSSQSFTLDYVITDPDQGDSITVEIQQDDREPEVYKNITVGVRRYLTIDTSGYSLGDHKIVIKATDSQGASNTRTYTWTKVNNAPVISGSDKDLGAKNTGFTITYQVKDQDGDKVNIIEKLNGEVLRNLANAGQETDIQLTIPTDKIAGLEINKLNTIEIEVSDSKGGVSYRRYTFTRDNFPPIISGTNTTISPGKDRVAYSYSVTDEEKDPIKVTTYLDNTVLERDKAIEDGKTYKIEISGQDFLKIRPGKHTLKIEATDGNSESVVRLVNFERSVTRFIIEKDTPFETDVAAKKIYVGLNGAVHVAEGAVLKVEVCNNGFDLQPTWEDATSVSLANKSFNFQNTKKTAEKWGINMRVTVDRDQASRDSSATGLGGSFE